MGLTKTELNGIIQAYKDKKKWFFLNARTFRWLKNISKEKELNNSNDKIPPEIKRVIAQVILISRDKPKSLAYKILNEFTEALLGMKGELKDIRDHFRNECNQLAMDMEEDWRNENEFRYPFPIPADELNSAINRGEIGLIQTLLAIGFDKNVLLLDAVNKRDIICLKALLKAGGGAKLHLTATHKKFILPHNFYTYYATALKINKSPEILIDENASLNHYPKGYISHLLWAAFWGDPDYVSWLIKNGADPNIQISGQTPLMVAVINNNIDCVSALLEVRADVSIRNNAGSTVLHLAAEKMNPEIVKMLIEKSNVDIDSQNKNGHTAIQIAAMKGDVKTINILLDAGADQYILNHDGKTTLKDYQEISMLLKDDKLNIVNTPAASKLRFLKIISSPILFNNKPKEVNMNKPVPSLHIRDMRI